MRWICIGLLGYCYFTDRYMMTIQMIIICITCLSARSIYWEKKFFYESDYPRNRYRHLGKYHILFGFNKKKGALMPVELIIMVKLTYELAIVASIMLWTVGAFFPKTTEYILWGYVILFLIVYGYFDIKASNIVFYGKYKRFTWHNWIYYDWSSLNHPDPESKPLETCAVTDIQKKRKRTYVTVRGEVSGKIMDKVLLCGKGKCHIGETYTVYQICDVKYIQL